MSRNDKLIDELDRKFANYHNYNREIAIRKLELAEREIDENVGGGKSNIVGNPVESKVIKEQSDPYILNRRLWKRAVEDTLEEQNSEVSKLIQLKYFGEDSWMDWRSFGVKHHYSTRTIYRIRQRVLLEFGRKIGEYR
ncbi:hypothetical protein ACFFIF_01895 [Vagococcus entomophilus]|uniref:hypothetical protein n=1 Tax=Vagococcus entomophilus TaxID=1160095 RepID=UPI001475D317|nr:hypothetical protein [Vagococcus entomophilus]